MTILVSYSLKNKNTGDLIKIQSKVQDFFYNHDDFGKEVNYFFNEDNDSSAKEWITDSLACAVFYKDFEKLSKFSSMYIPNVPNSINIDNYEVVVIYQEKGQENRIITTKNVPQSVFSFIPNIEHFFKISCMNRKKEIDIERYKFLMETKKKISGKYIVDTGDNSRVWKEIIKQKLTPDLSIDFLDLNHSVKI